MTTNEQITSELGLLKNPEYVIRVRECVLEPGNASMGFSDDDADPHTFFLLGTVRPAGLCGEITEKHKKAHLDSRIGFEALETRIKLARTEIAQEYLRLRPTQYANLNDATAAVRMTACHLAYDKAKPLFAEYKYLHPKTTTPH